MKIDWVNHMLWGALAGLFAQPLLWIVSAVLERTDVYATNAERGFMQLLAFHAGGWLVVCLGTLGWRVHRQRAEIRLRQTSHAAIRKPGDPLLTPKKFPWWWPWDN